VSRVLVVEDDPGIARLLKRGLALKGIETTIAEDGFAGRELWEAGGFDLVILDMMLPGVDGLTVCAERRAAGDEVPVILLTARDEQEVKEKASAAGATDYVSKPFSFPELLDRISGLLVPG
jgi:DNA-binding response OmpR family regulator